MNNIFADQIRQALGLLKARSHSLSSQDMVELNEEVDHIFRTLGWSLQLNLLVEDSAELMQQLHNFIETRGHTAYWLPLLKEAYEHPSMPTNQKLLLQNQLCNAHRCRGDLKSSIAVGLDALEKTPATDNLETRMKLHYNVALAYENARKFELADQHCQQSKKIFKQIDSNHLFLKINLPNLDGLIQLGHGNYSDAIDRFIEALKLASKYEKPGMEMWIVGNLGLAAFRMGRYEQAIPYYQQSLELAESGKDYFGCSLAWLNIGTVNIELGNWKEALEAYENAQSEFIYRFGTLTHRAKIATSVGDVYQRSGNYISADLHLSDAIEMWEQTDEIVELAYAVGLLGLQRSGAGDTPDAIRLFEKSLDLLKGPVAKGDRLAVDYQSQFTEALGIAKKKNQTVGAPTV